MTDSQIKISLCIPTYNRGLHLANCLQSINTAARDISDVVEVCISDNGSTDCTQDVVSKANMSVPTTYHRNEQNLGIPRNFLNVVEMAKGEFVWLIGDDDLLIPESLTRLLNLLEQHELVDFFYVNAFHLTTEYVLSFPQPFDTTNLPSMEPFSTWSKSGELPFFKLIDPKISFDFLGGMFLSVFRRRHWINHKHHLNEYALTDSLTFSHFDNTFPHVKIFSTAFKNSRAYFNASPLIVTLSGAREWAPMYPFIRSVRLIEALRLYRDSGLPWLQYMKCRNFALGSFLPDLVRMILNPTQTGLRFVSLSKHVLSNSFYPNVYLSPLRYLARRLYAPKQMVPTHQE